MTMLTQRQLLWLWASLVQGVFRGQIWPDRKSRLFPIFIKRGNWLWSFWWCVHSPEPVLLETCPWVKRQWRVLVACSSYICRHQRKAEISERSMEPFCHVSFSLSGSPAVTTWDLSIRLFCETLQVVSDVRGDELEGPASLLVGHLSVKKILRFFIPGSKHYLAATQKIFTRLLLVIIIPVLSLVIPLAFR